MKRERTEIWHSKFSELLALVTALFLLTTISVAQEGLAIRSNVNQKSPSAEAGKVYLSACAAVQREFGSSHDLRPRVTLVLGVEKHGEGVDVDSREIRLVKWNRYMFAQGVVILAFEELMPKTQVLLVAKRAVAWSDATVDVGQIAK
ncbi:MAG: hypothetical protein DMG62_23365 [Acidobacteria bacterium]|nr:MAG: hypothetical protein DMG63_01040 [Acidobacteriota bacterium]PYY20508.1 MAG: hypothetical protein DMG62_23365 [Acidobacteriota bacterium]